MDGTPEKRSPLLRTANIQQISDIPTNMDKKLQKTPPPRADDTATPPDKEKDEKAYFQHLNYIMYCDAYP